MHRFVTLIACLFSMDPAESVADAPTTEPIEVEQPDTGPSVWEQAKAWFLPILEANGHSWDEFAAKVSNQLNNDPVVVGDTDYEFNNILDLMFCNIEIADEDDTETIEIAEDTSPAEAAA